MIPFRAALLASASSMGGGGSVSGALVYRSGTDDTSATESNYNAEAYDDDGWHDNSTNPHRLTVPSGVSYARFAFCNRRTGGTIGDKILKDGASFGGDWGFAAGDTPGFDAASAATAIVAVSSGQVFSIDPGGLSDGGVYTSPDSWFGVEVIDSLTDMALVQKTGSQALSAATTTTLTWDNEVRDTAGFHDNSTNNSRLTVPSGASLVRVSANIVNDATTSGTSTVQFVISFQKNGASAVGLPVKDQTRQNNTNCIGGVSAILAVSSGDYFEARAFHTDATNIVSDNGTWFQIEVVDPATKYALVTKSATQAISAATFTAVAWGAETADTDGLHDNSTNNSRLTVPSGVTQARLSFNLVSASAAGQLIGEIRKNGSFSVGLPRQETDTAGTDNINGFGMWVDVTAGDYFELFVYADTAQTLPVNDGSWMCIECR